MRMESKEMEMEFKDSNWVHVPGWVVNHIGNTMTEVMAYSAIYGFSQDGKSVYMGSAAYLAGICKCTRQHMMTVLKSMVERGYLERTNKMIDGEFRPCYKAIVPQGIEKTPEGCEPTGEMKSKDETKDICPATESTPKRKRKASEPFVPPTEDEVRELFKAKGFVSDPHEFYLYWSNPKHNWNQPGTFELELRAYRWEKNNKSWGRYGSTSKDSEQMSEIAKGRQNNEDNGIY